MNSTNEFADDLRNSDDEGAENSPLPSGDADIEISEEKNEYIKTMRLEFCSKEMLLDGEINEHYFEAKEKADSLVWDDEQEQRLKVAVAEYGLGSLNKLVEDIFPYRTSEDIRLRLCRLFGKQDITKYILSNFSGSPEDIDKELLKNRSAAMKADKLVKGLYKGYDDKNNRFRFLPADM